MSELHSGTEEEDEEARPHPLSIEAMLQACWIRHEPGSHRGCRPRQGASMIRQEFVFRWSEDLNLGF